MSLAKAVPLTCTGHSRPVTDLQFTEKLSPVEDTRLYLLISACKDGQPMLRDGVSGDWIGTFLGHQGAIWCSRLTTDGAYAITGSADFSAIVWDTHHGQPIAHLPHKHIVRSCDFAPGSNKHSVSAAADNEGLTFGEDLHVVTAGQEKIVRVWNVRTQLVIKQWDYQSQHALKVVRWVAKTQVVTVDAGGLVTWWDISREPKQLHTVVIGSDVGQVEYHRDKEWIIAAAGTKLYIIHGETGEFIKSLDVQYKVNAIALNHKLTRFVTGSGNDTHVRVHEFDTGKLLDTIKGHHGPVHVASYSPDGCLVATGSEDGTIRLWKTCDGAYGLWNRI